MMKGKPIDVDPGCDSNVASAYRQAAEWTVGTIRRRGIYYRNLVVVVVLILFGAPIWAVVAGAWLPLAEWLFIVPVCAAFFTLDAILVARWRKRLFSWWCQERMEMALFRGNMENVGGLPVLTLTAMLDELPVEMQNIRTDQLSPDGRRAVAVTLRSAEIGRTIRQVALSIALGVLATAANLALYAQSIQPLLALGLIPVAWAIAAAGGWACKRSWRTGVRAHHDRGGEIAPFLQASRHVGWTGEAEKLYRALHSD